MLGFSGSGGGVTYPLRRVDDYVDYVKNVGKNLELRYVDYFVNNVCNLLCRHCYVEYESNNNDLTIEEWERVFDFCIESGARVFGNVGKEPTLTWEKTKSLLSYFKNRKEKIPNIKYGIVTNGLLIDKKKVDQLKILNLDYIDISIDGSKAIHDKIRGKGTFAKTIQNILRITKEDMQKKLFISYTLNKINQHSFASLMHELYQLGIKNYLVSPYLTNRINDKLELTTHEYVNSIEDLMLNKSINWDAYKDINLYIRNDFTSRKYQNELLEQKIVDTEKLFKDDNDGVYYIYNVETNNIVFNVQTWNPDFWYALRISHDGYVSNCFDMSFPGYPERAIGNVRANSISEILQNQAKSITKPRMVSCCSDR